ncbi:MAG: hypothetical protein AAF481_08845 [Acidobacteriota bacterium]
MQRARVVVTDANVLINLAHVHRLDFCARLAGLEFVIPDHVRDEVTRREHREALEESIEAGVFKVVSLTEADDIAAFAALTVFLGRGEASCLVLASRHGWLVASDEKGRFRREAIDRVGEGKILGTVEIYLRALQAGLLTIEEADQDKTILEARRFRMPFCSFGDVVARSDA